MSVAITKDEAAAFCEEGHAAGFLVRSGRMPDALHALAAPGGDGLEPRADALQYEADERGVDIDPARSSPEALVQLAAVSRTVPAGARLRAEPDVVRLGRVASRLESLPALAKVRADCPAFEKAARHVIKRHGKLVLHEGLAVLRIDDVGLRALLLRDLGSSAVELDPTHVAIPAGLVDRVDKRARKEGYVPRRIS